MAVRRLVRFSLVAILSIVVVEATPVLGVTPALGDSPSSGEALSSSQDLEVVRDPATGAVRFLRSRKGLDSGVDVRALALDPSVAVFTFLDRYQDLLGMPNAPEELVLQERKVDQIGMIHIRLQQVHQGVPVYGAEVVVHYAADGQTVRVVNGRFIPNLAVQPEPTLDREAAVELVRNTQPEGELWEDPLLRIYSGHIDPAVSGDHLAWLVRIFDATEPSRMLYVVDAHTGVILTRYNELDTARKRRIYNADHGTSLPGRLVRSEEDKATGDEDADAAYEFLGHTYDYFQDKHGRDSYDDAGAELLATVHYGTDYQNAFWNGQQMVFGDEYAVDDVTAHELMHAVTEHSANLIYQNQSGALNESFSDIFGEIVDQNHDRIGEDAALWLIGEDLPNGAIRDMARPPEYGDPDTVSDYVCTSSDNGGVHTNSGIPNKAAYLMAEGGTFNGRTIEPIGLSKMGQIQYHVLTLYLTSSSSFLDYYLLVNQSCNDLIEADAFTSEDCEQVDAALLAVEMSMELECSGGWETAYSTLFASPSDLELLRRYRDEFLTTTTKGRLYTRLLYKHSEEALAVLLNNPELMVEAADLIRVNRAAITEVMDGGQGVIYDSGEILSFLRAFAKKSPLALRFWATVIRSDMRIRQRLGRSFLDFRLE